MAARNAKQARSQHEPLTASEMLQLLELINRSRANGQLEGVLAQAQIHVIGMETPMSPASDSDAGFSVVNEGSRNSGGQAAPKGPPPPPGYAAATRGHGNKSSPSAMPKGPPPPATSASTWPSMPGGPPPPTSAGAKPTSIHMEQTDVTAIARLEIFRMPTVAKTPLAPGVPDLQTWSKTLFELPKYRSLQLSYKGILAKAWDDASMLSYIRWIGNTYAQEAKNPKAGKASDFAAFLLAVGFPAAERQKEVEGRRRTFAEE